MDQDLGKVMPLYEFQCKKCGYRFEELTTYDARDPRCDKCDSDKTVTLVSRTSFSLKGGGWYKDRYGLKPSKVDKPSEGG